MKLFVYATLKDPVTRAKALHHKEPTKEVAALPGYVETIVTDKHGTKWPTLVKASPDRYVSGDIIEVEPHELIHADEWEDHYDLTEVKTGIGEAWTYILKGMASRE